jgi:ATP-dependent Zn protease
MSKGTAPRKPRFQVPILVLSGVLLLLWGLRERVSPPQARSVPYSEIVSDVEAGRVEQAEIRATQVIAKLRGDAGRPGESLVAERIPNMDDRSLLDALERQHVIVTGQEQQTSWWGPLLSTLLPLLLLPLLLFDIPAGLGAAAGRGRPMTWRAFRAGASPSRARWRSLSFPRRPASA